MKKSDLYREWARVLDMCEGTNVEPYQCWGYGGFRSTQRHEPSFNEIPLEKYEFAVAILEGKPVFVGDTVWHLRLDRYMSIVDTAHIRVLIENKHAVWNPPKKTFTLNGVEFDEIEMDLLINMLSVKNMGFIDTVRFNINFDKERKMNIESLHKLLQDATK